MWFLSLIKSCVCVVAFSALFQCLDLHMDWVIKLKFWSCSMVSLLSCFEDSPPKFCVLSSKSPSILYLSADKNTQTIQQCLWSRLAPTDLPYLSLITRRTLLTALVLSCVGKCVRYVGDVGWCKCSTTCCLWGGSRWWVSCAAAAVEGWTWVNQSSGCRHEVTGRSRLQQSGNFGGILFHWWSSVCRIDPICCRSRGRRMSVCTWLVAFVCVSVCVGV